MKIEPNKVVSIHYTLTNKNNDILDSSSGTEPLSYLHGAGNIIPGLEKALTGKTKGEKFKVIISPEEAYGVRDDRLQQEIAKDQFPPEQDISVGMAFQVQTPQGPGVLYVTKVEGDKITVDGNHPLAGEELHFNVEVGAIRDASKEEMEHGHVHGPGGHHH